MRTPGWLIPMIVIVFLGSCSHDTTGPGNGNTPIKGEYLVLAWNDLGMHCLNPTYDKAVVLPPYNTLWAQVIKRDVQPQIVTAGITVEYRIEHNATSYGKRSYGQFWDNAAKLFGIADLPHDIGLKGKGLSGAMDVSGNHFIAEGIPVTPVGDDGVWNPYQVAVITVTDSQGHTLAQTKTTIPTSDEMHCDKCHGADAFNDLLVKHDAGNGTDLSHSKPVLCAGCHGDPALGLMSPGSSGIYLSKAMHGFHADKDASCYDCHPGKTTQCSRSMRHTADDGYCLACHGGMARVANSIPIERIPWINEPKCALCHSGGIAQVNTGDALYRFSQGHGQLYCESCHGSPHAMIPSLVASDNYQALQYQGFTGKVKTLGSCGGCHDSSRGGDEIGDFAEEHGGTGPSQYIGCHICHTALSTDTAKWPHSFQWRNSN